MSWQTQYIMHAQTTTDGQSEKQEEFKFVGQRGQAVIQPAAAEREAVGEPSEEVIVTVQEGPAKVEQPINRKEDLVAPPVLGMNTQSIAQILEPKPNQQPEPSFEMMTSIQSNESIIPSEEKKVEPNAQIKTAQPQAELKTKSDNEEENAFKTVDPIIAQQLRPQSLQENFFAPVKQANPTAVSSLLVSQPTDPISQAQKQQQIPTQKNQPALSYYGISAKIEVLHPQKPINSSISEPSPASTQSIPSITPGSEVKSGSTIYTPVRKEIRPPSPKGERKPKPWQRLGAKKIVAPAQAKPQETAKVQPTIVPSSAITSTTSEIVVPKIQQQPSIPPTTVSNPAESNPGNPASKKFKLETKIYELTIQNSKKSEGQSFQQTMKSAPSPLSPLAFKFYQNQYEKYRIPTTETQVKQQEKSAEQDNEEPISKETASKPPIISFTEQPNKQLDQPIQKTIHHNPLLEYQRYAPKQQPQPPLPQQIQPQQPPAVEPPEAEPLAPVRPLSSVSSDEDNVIIRDASFERDGVQKAKEKSKQIEELESQIRRQQQLNRELEKQTSFAIKLAISGAIGLITAGISWTARKSRVAAAIMGAAAGAGTFLLHK